MKFRLTFKVVLGFLCTLLMQCRKESALSPQETDTLLLAKATPVNGFSYYKNDSAIIRSSPQSAHAGYFRVRFNDIAERALTDGGKLPVGASFPTGSLVVKELHTDSTGNNLIGYAVMEKSPTDTSAAQGWVWAEYITSGAGGYKIGGKGAICTGCHSTNDRDKVRLFNLFP